MNKIIQFSLIISAFFVLLSCRNEGNKENQADSGLVSVMADSNKPIPVFYELLLPMDMSRVFEQSGTVYDKEILNPVEKVSNYSASAKVALNLGVYGVDLGYIKIFGDPQAAIRYFGVIHKLSGQLGIPDDFLAGALQRFEQNVNNRDSINVLVTTLYEETDGFLKKADRAEASSLIIMGGWIEGMYIAGRILEQEQEKGKNDMVNRIASQKYALNNLITLLTNHSNDASVSRYLVFLKHLRSSFSKVEIYYGQGKVDLDTVNKTIQSGDYKVKIDPEILTEITSQVNAIRKEIVD